jgi:hypothetical protein
VMKLRKCNSKNTINSGLAVEQICPFVRQGSKNSIWL